MSQGESSQSGPILSEEAEAKVSTFPGGRVGSGEGWGRGKHSQLCLQQGVLEGDDPGMETSGPGDTEARGDLEETPEVVGLEPDSQDLEDQSPPHSLPSSPNTGESPPGFPSLSF